MNVAYREAKMGVGLVKRVGGPVIRTFSNDAIVRLTTGWGRVRRLFFREVGRRSGLASSKGETQVVDTDTARAGVTVAEATAVPMPSEAITRRRLGRPASCRRAEMLVRPGPASAP